MSLDRLDLVERDRRTGRLEAEQAAQRRALLALIVDQLRVFLEDVVLARPRRVLQAETVSGLNRWTSPSRRHWYSPPLSRSTRARRASAEGARVTLADFLRDHRHADAADAGGGGGEVLLHERRDRARPPRRSARRNSSEACEMPILDITFSTPLLSALM